MSGQQQRREEELRALFKELFQEPIRQLSFSEESFYRKPFLRRLLIEFETNNENNRRVLIQRKPHRDISSAIESIFYSQLSHLSTASLPVCLHSSQRQNSSDGGGDEIITIFQDLPDLNLSDASNDLNMLQVKAAVTELGRFHSSFFSQEQLPAQVPSPSVLTTGHCNYEANVPLFMERWGSLLEEFTEEDGKNIQEVFRHCSRHVQNWTFLLEMGPCSLIHGNYRPENLILCRGQEAGSDQVTIFNFQSIFQGRNRLAGCLLC
jgi:hypothetical protein